MRFIVLFIVFIGVPLLVCAEQKPYPPPPPMPDYSQYEAGSLEKLQERYPTLYQMNARILELNQGINNIKKEYEAGELTEDEALERVRPLLLERVRLENSPEFQTEVQLNTIIPEGKGAKKGKLVIR